MTENPKLEDMESDHLVTNGGESGENQKKICVVDHVNGLHHSITKSDSFVVDMDRFSHHLVEKETVNPANSRIITLQRNLSRKGSFRTTERKVTSNERDVSMLTTSPKATFHGGTTMLEKQTVVAPGPHDHTPTTHHQITITNPALTAPASESKVGARGRRFSFRRSSSTWTVDPRRMLFFFATLSCMGTMMLIYFTLSMGKQAQGE